MTGLQFSGTCIAPDERPCGPGGGGKRIDVDQGGLSSRGDLGPWSTVQRPLAATAGKAFIGSRDALMAILAQALAGGAVLALAAHAMIPVALEEGGSLLVLPTVAGLLFALYLTLAESLV